MGIHWLTLLAPIERAIPESFLSGLRSGGVEPVLHFRPPIQAPLSIPAFRLLFSNYFRWGVKYVALFDRPNSRLNWKPAAWAQADLVERFLDLFIPLAEAAMDEGLIPVFPPLEPGGDYWDLSFLRSALRGVQSRGRFNLLERMALSAFAWIGKKPLDWGAGGSVCWPEARPYFTPDHSQDHKGFRIFEWYLEVAQSEAGRSLPLLLLRAGSVPEDCLSPETGKPDFLAHAELNRAAAKLFMDEPSGDAQIAPPEVLACNFWLLAAHAKSGFTGEAWFSASEERLPVVNAFYRLSARALEDQTGSDNPQVKPEPTLAKSTCKPVPDASGVQEETEALPHSMEDIEELPEGESPEPVAQQEDHLFEISHYVLLPLYAWGAAEWDLEIIQPMLQGSHPTVGFSLAEARLAARVTVVGGEGAISAEALEMLRASGCQVERVLDDGTLVAT